MRRPTTSPAFYARSNSRSTVVVKSKDDENTSPESLKPSSPTPPLSTLKESRAWEHERQRLKKATALLNRKARKAQAATQPPAERLGHRGGAGVRVDDDGNEEQPAVEENEVEWGGATSPVRADGDRAEVALSDLLIARKPRHGRERDFEIIPTLRSVIVLDDKFSAPAELDFDEPWEHVYASDADDSLGPELSYAKIAALN